MLIPTPEQTAIIEFAKHQKENLLINALAGSAKTSSLDMVSRALTSIPILSLAFNKRIADEMQKRLPPHVKAQTFNSLGHGIWSGVVGRRLVLNPDKMRDIVRDIIKSMNKRNQEKAWDEMGDTMQWLRRAKRDGYVPAKWRGQVRYSMDPETFFASYEDEPSPLQMELIDLALNQSILNAYNALIDYDDQILMPVCFGGSFPKYPLVLVDEFQDLNELQHEMLDKLTIKRMIGVGDKNQSIYFFRGTKANGMEAARERWNMHELPLSVTFRVPQAGVRRAWFRVPHMRWTEGALEGEIKILDEWKAADIPDGAAIICRNNAPLFSCAIQLLRSGRGVRLVGFDIGPGLIRVMKNLGPPDLRGEALEAVINQWAFNEAVRGRKESTIEERRECLHTLVANKPNLRAAIDATEDLFKQKGLIQLMTIHKAKGLEWDDVYHLDPWRIPSRFAREGTEEWEQELNARYVAETRFKQSLSLVTLEGMI